MIGSKSSESTTSHLVGKYRKNVLSEISTSSMICCTVVASYPCVRKRCIACARIIWRVRSFFRSRRPGARTSADAGKLTPHVRWHSLIVLQRVAAREEEQREHQPYNGDPGRDDERDVHAAGERAAHRQEQ